MMRKLFVLLIPAMILFSASSRAASVARIKGKERSISLELQGELTPWASSRTGGGLGLRYGMGVLSPDLRVRYVQGNYRALFARLGDSQASSNVSSEYEKRMVENGRMKGFLIEPGLQVRGSIARGDSRWEQTARIGIIYGTLRDEFYSENVQVAALSAELGLPYRMNSGGTWFLIPYIGYEYGFAHRVPEAEGEMRQYRNLYYLSYRGGIGFEWVF